MCGWTDDGRPNINPISSHFQLLSTDDEVDPQQKKRGQGRGKRYVAGKTKRCKPMKTTAKDRAAAALILGESNQGAQMAGGPRIAAGQQWFNDAHGGVARADYDETQPMADCKGDLRTAFEEAVMDIYEGKISKERAKRIVTEVAGKICGIVQNVMSHSNPIILSWTAVVNSHAGRSHGSSPPPW
jgi:hypothetical protein